jgi:hypothetical protein
MRKQTNMKIYKVAGEFFPVRWAEITRDFRSVVRLKAVLAWTAFCFVGLPHPALGQPSNGLVGGITRDFANGKPLPGTRVVAHNANKGAETATVSDSDGNFAFSSLEPGSYELLATKNGFQKLSAHVDVTAAGTPHIDLILSAVHSDRPANGPLPQTAEATSSIVKELEAMRSRIEQLEAELRNRNAQDSAQTSEQPADTVLIATATRDGSAMPPLPGTLRKPGDKDLLAGNLPIGVPAPAQPSAPPAPAPPAPALPEALQAPDPAPAVDNFTPFAFGDFTWLNGTPRNKDTVLDTKFFTPEIRFDTHYMEDFNQPKDHTIGGATESFRSGEVQIEQASVGGDFHWQNVRGRILFMQGLFATTTPRNDASAGVGQWDLRGAYKYVSEAWGGYHFNVNHGLNVDAGIFVSYIGLFSYYNFDNWTYQPSYVSSNTPWFFNGVRVQWFPTNKLKIEPWFVNGWQSYAKYNGHPGLGGQILYMPREWLKIVANQYGFGQDNLGLPKTQRIHTDDSIEVRYYNNPANNGISKMAFSLTADAGCQYGGGLTCTGAPSQNKSSFVGWMFYNRIWFHKDLFGLTLGGGEMSNWGRYLTLLPPINGADAVSGSPYFTENPGQRAHMWDSTVTLQYMPKQYITWWTEVGYRHSDIPYFTGRGGITPPAGDTGSPSQYVCASGASSGTNSLTAAESACGGGISSVWFPDLRRSETKFSVGVMVKF